MAFGVSNSSGCQKNFVLNMRKTKNKVRRVANQTPLRLAKGIVTSLDHSLFFFSLHFYWFSAVAFAMEGFSHFGN